MNQHLEQNNTVQPFSLQEQEPLNGELPQSQDQYIADNIEELPRRQQSLIPLATLQKTDQVLQDDGADQDQIGSGLLGISSDNQNNLGVKDEVHSSQTSLESNREVSPDAFKSKGDQQKLLSGVPQIILSNQQQMMMLEGREEEEEVKPKFEVYMRCVTWSRDSHGLFDYESRYISKKNLKSCSGGRIIRINNDVEFVSGDETGRQTEGKPLLQITQNQNGKFTVSNDSSRSLAAATANTNTDKNKQTEAKSALEPQNTMFVVVRNLKSQQNQQAADQHAKVANFEHDHRLQKGDTIKLGRLKFRVKDFRTSNQPANCDLKRQGMLDRSASPVKQRFLDQMCEDSSKASPFTNGFSPSKNAFKKIQNDQEQENHQDDDSENEFNEEEAVEIDCGVVESVAADGTEIQCKVCWSNEQTRENPLLNSCRCDGSVRFIHYECLKFWLKQKMATKEEPHQISYLWKQFECEICKKPYPYVFKSNGSRYKLVDVDIPTEGNFLWLESLTFEKNSSRMVHVVKPDSTHSQFKLGRGHESDLRVSDISVSRCHALLKYDHTNTQGFFLEDNLSKFGTLVMANKPIELEEEETQAIQIGRSVISFTVKRVLDNQKQPSPSKKVAVTQPIQMANSAIQNQRLQNHQHLNNLQQNPHQQQHQVIPQILTSTALQTTLPASHSRPAPIVPTTHSFIAVEESKQDLRTPSPTNRASKRAQQAHLLSAASHLRTANRQALSMTPEMGQRTSNVRQQNGVSNVYANSHLNNNTVTAREQREPQSPEDIEEMLKQKIEETSQKISAYLSRQPQGGVGVSAAITGYEHEVKDSTIDNQRSVAGGQVSKNGERPSQNGLFYAQQNLGAATESRKDQKRHNYLLSQQKQVSDLTADRQHERKRHQSRAGQGSLAPQKLNFYDLGEAQNSNHSSESSFEVSIAAQKVQSRPVERKSVPSTSQPRFSYQTLGDVPPKSSNQTTVTNQQYGALSSQSQSQQTNVNPVVQQASNSLNQTLQRFQNMVKQVEQRFADREVEGFNAANESLDSNRSGDNPFRGALEKNTRTYSNQKHVEETNSGRPNFSIHDRQRVTGVSSDANQIARRESNQNSYESRPVYINERNDSTGYRQAEQFYQQQDLLGSSHGNGSSLQNKQNLLNMLENATNLEKSPSTVSGNQNGYNQCENISPYAMYRQSHVQNQNFIKSPSKQVKSAKQAQGGSPPRQHISQAMGVYKPSSEFNSLVSVPSDPSFGVQQQQYHQEKVQQGTQNVTHSRASQPVQKHAELLAQIQNTIQHDRSMNAQKQGNSVVQQSPVRLQKQHIKSPQKAIRKSVNQSPKKHQTDKKHGYSQPVRQSYTNATSNLLRAEKQNNSNFRDNDIRRSYAGHQQPSQTSYSALNSTFRHKSAGKTTSSYNNHQSGNDSSHQYQINQSSDSKKKQSYYHVRGRYGEPTVSSYTASNQKMSSPSKSSPIKANKGPSASTTSHPNNSYSAQYQTKLHSEARIDRLGQRQNSNQVAHIQQQPMVGSFQNASRYGEYGHNVASTSNSGQNVPSSASPYKAASSLSAAMRAVEQVQSSIQSRHAQYSRYQNHQELANNASAIHGSTYSPAYAPVRSQRHDY